MPTQPAAAVAPCCCCCALLHLMRQVLLMRTADCDASAARSATCPHRPTPAGDLKNIRGQVQHIGEDGGVMVMPQDEALPDFSTAIRFEPRELAKDFEVLTGR